MCAILCNKASHIVVLQVVGVKGPLVDKAYAMEINPLIDLGWHHQSVAFIVLY